MKHFPIASLLTGLLLSSVGASALGLPDMKPGLWQTTMQHSSSSHPAADRARTATNCLDVKTQAAAKQTAVDYAKKNCSKNETRKNGAEWVTDMVCKVDSKTTMTTHSVTKFEGIEAYHTEMTTTFEPPMAGQSHTSTIVDGKWLGVCGGK